MRALSIRSKIRAWSCYAALGYVAVTQTIVGVSIDGLAKRAGVVNPYKLHYIFVGRLFGGLLGTPIGGALIDILPVKLLMGGFMVISASSLFAIPYFARLGPEVLVVIFGLLGFSGSALVTCATTAACWAFPGEKVAPINSGMAASFGVTSAALPILLLLAHGDLEIQYMLSMTLVLPALILLLMSDAPVKPDAQAKDTTNSIDSVGQTAKKRERVNWIMAFMAAISQLLLQGAYSSLLVWLPEFGIQRVSTLKEHAALFVSVLQGCVTLGALFAMQYQRRFELESLACGQLSLVVVSLFVWSFFSDSEKVGFCAVAIFGFFGGSTLGYPNSLYNKYTTPSGKQLSLISLGTNAGASLGPYTAGLVMSRAGPSALIVFALSANVVVLAGMISLKITTRSVAVARARELDAKRQSLLANKLLGADAA